MNTDTSAQKNQTNTQVLTLPQPLFFLGPILALASIFGLRMLGLFMILPVFALYTTQFNHVTPFKTGLVLGIYGLTQAFFQVPFGMLSDKFGRKPIIILGLCLFILGSLIAGLSDSIDGVILGRFLQGLAAIGSVMMALAADLSSERYRSQAMAILGIMIGASFALAFILSPIISHWLNGIRGLFLFSAVLAFLSIIILVLFVPRVSLTEKNAPPVIFLLKNPILMSLNSGILILHASLTALFLKIPLLIENLGFTKSAAWQLYLPVFVLSMILCFPVLYGLDKFSIQRLNTLQHFKKFKLFLLLIMVVFMFSEISLLTLNHHLAFFFTAFTLFFTTFNILEAWLPALLSKVVEPHYRGTAMGIFSSFQFLGLFVGGVLGGLADMHFSIQGIIILCFIFALIWFIICRIFFKISEVHHGKRY